MHYLESLCGFLKCFTCGMAIDRCHRIRSSRALYLNDMDDKFILGCYNTSGKYIPGNLLHIGNRGFPENAVKLLSSRPSGNR